MGASSSKAKKIPATPSLPRNPSSNPAAPQTLTKLASSIPKTIVDLVNACYQTQSAVYLCDISTPRNIYDAVQNHRASLLQLLDDRSTPAKTPKIDISWFFAQAKFVAQDISYAQQHGGANLAPLARDSITRVAELSLGMNGLLSQQRKLLEEWRKRSDMIRAFITQARRKKNSGRGPLNDRNSKKLPEIPDGLASLEQVTALQTMLIEQLESFANFWDKLHGLSSIQMTAGDVDEWARAGTASGQARTEIKAAYAAYVAPPRPK